MLLSDFFAKGAVISLPDAPEGDIFVRKTNTWVELGSDEAKEKVGVSECITRSGDRGELSGSETAAVLAGDQTITVSSPDTIVMKTSGALTLTFTPAAENVTAIKIIALTATDATTLTVAGASWTNNEEDPTWGDAGKMLILTAHFIAGKVLLTVGHNDQ